jgi:carbonic anhydrase/acetyltransferase-like protein (isoleucine patch superfamily)
MKDEFTRFRGCAAFGKKFAHPQQYNMDGTPRGFIAEWVDLANISPTAWIGPNAQVCGIGSRVLDNARVEDYAVVHDNATVSGNAVVSGYAFVFGDSEVTDFATVTGPKPWKGALTGTRVTGSVFVGDNAKVGGAKDGMKTRDGWAYLGGEGSVTGDAHVTGAVIKKGNFDY